MIRVFIGYDPALALDHFIAQESIITTSSKPVCITPISLSNLKGKGGLFRESDPMQSNDFTFSRWLTPHLCNYQDWAIYLDSDVILVDDMIAGITEIEAQMGMGSGAISLDDMLISIGNNVLNIRKTRGINQGILANLAGVDRAYISLVENGKQNLTMAALVKLADALNVPVTSLIPASRMDQDI